MKGSRSGEPSGLRRILFTIVPPLLVGLVFSLLLVTTFVTALHSPSFHDVEVAVTGPGAEASELARELNADSSLGLDAEVVSGRAAARAQIEQRDVYGAFVLGAGGNTVLVAAAANEQIATELPQIFNRVLASEGQGSARTVDVVPLPDGDRTGSVGYFLMLGLAIGAYFSALMLNNFVHLRLAGQRLALARLGTLACYAPVASLLALLIADPIVGALQGPFVTTWLFLVLLTFAVAAFANALIHFFGAVGTAIVIILVTAFGNPSAGGSVAWPLLPGFYSAIGPWTPNGAATDGIRNIVYFDGNALGRPLLVLFLYAAVGIAITLVAAAVRRARPEPRPVAEAEAAGSGAGASPLAP